MHAEGVCLIDARPAHTLQATAVPRLKNQPAEIEAASHMRKEEVPNLLL
jgi:hypothetical protein